MSGKSRKFLKRLLALALTVSISAGAAAAGTVAYLKDQDSDTNVMTLGNVKIEQIEQEWNADKTDLVAFTQSKPLYPYVGELGWTNTARSRSVLNNDAYRRFTMDNVVDKYVSVKNTGKSDAYVRTLFAFEMGGFTSVDEFRNNIIGLNRNAADGAEFDFPGTWVWDSFSVTQINGQRYMLGVATHQKPVKPGETTIPSLLQVYMNKNCTNEDVEKIDGNKNGLYDILVVSQAVQTTGFSDAATALAAGFGPANDPAWFADLKIPSGPSSSDGTGLAYQVNGDEVTVTGYDGPGGEITIPETVSGYPVTAIGEAAFYNRSDVSLTDLPDSIETIGDWAFAYTNAALTDLPAGLISIGEYAFYDCTNVKLNCALPEGLGSIGDSAFENCGSINLTLSGAPTQTASLSDLFFMEVSADDTCDLGENAFHGVSSLCLNDPEGHHKGRNGWDDYKHHFEDGRDHGKKPPYRFEADGEANKDGAVPGIYIDKDTMLVYACNPDSSGPHREGRCAVVMDYLGAKKKASTDIVIPSTVEFKKFDFRVTDVKENVFKNRAELTSAMVSEGVIYIEQRAFSGCTSLSSVQLPESLDRLGSRVFENCISLQELQLPDVGSLDSAVFDDCSLTIYTSGTPGEIREDTFCNMQYLKIVVPADEVQTYKTAWAVVEDHIFAEGDKTPGSSTGSSNPDPGPGPGPSAPDPVYTSGDFTFALDPHSMTASMNRYRGESAKVTVPSEVEVTETSRGPGGITEDQLGTYQVTGIGSGAFMDNASVTSITLPSSIEKIGGAAFENCDSLCSITLPGSITDMGQFLFDGCSSLQKVVLSEGITTISMGMFRGCYNLTDVTLPSTLTVIDAVAFDDCKSLQKLNIPDSVTWIGGGAFRQCSSLTLNGLPTSLKSIGKGLDGGIWDSAFGDMKELKLTQWPEKLNYIGVYTFRTNACKYETIHITSRTPAVLGDWNGENDSYEADVFNLDYLKKIYVPDDCVAAYKAAWPRYKDYIFPASEYDTAS